MSYQYTYPIGAYTTPRIARCRGVLNRKRRNSNELALTRKLRPSALRDGRNSQAAAEMCKSLGVNLGLEPYIPVDRPVVQSILLQGSIWVMAPSRNTSPTATCARGVEAAAMWSSVASFGRAPMRRRTVLLNLLYCSYQGQ